jgi:hypothetical protein
VRVSFENLGVLDTLQVLNVSDDSAALEALKESSGQDKAPCLMLDGQPLLESGDICQQVANRIAPVG